MDIILRILEIMNSKGIKATQLTADLGLSKNVVSEWKRGRIKPSIEIIIKLAKYFNTEDVSKVELFKIIKRDDAKYSLSTEDLLLRYEYPNEEDELTPVQPFIF